MAAAYPTITLYANLNGVWTDITAYFEGTSQNRAEVRQGMSDNRRTSRIARVGEFVFYLRNPDGRFSPGHASVMSGWQAGIGIKLVLTYDGHDYPSLWHIASPDGIEIAPGERGQRWVKVTCLDWMDYADKWPVVNPGILSNKRGGEVLTQVLALMTKTPAATDFDTTVNTFPTVFDTVTSKTTALKEISKVVFSEVGYGYIVPDRTNGETLVLEANTRRSGLDTETIIPVASEVSGRGLREDGGYELREDGGYELRDETEVFDVAANIMGGTDIVHGRHLLNYVTSWAYPRKVDASAVILFRLSEPIAIAPGETITIKGTYADPSGGLPVNGQNMITPVATTDYLFYANSDGTGTDLTANIVLVSTPYGTEGFTHQVRNGGTSTGYLTQYNCRGYGIYQYNPTQHVAQDSDSIDDFGVVSDTIHAKYLKTTQWVGIQVDSWVELDKRQETRVNSITFFANRSPQAMQAFLNLTIGDVVRVTETKTALDTYAYIQGMEYTILPRRIIMCKWILQGFLSLSLGMSMLGVELNISPVSQAAAIDYGVVEYLQGMTQRTHVVSALFTDLTGTLDTLVVVGGSTTDGYLQVYVDNFPANGTLYVDWRFSGGTSVWHSTSTTLSPNTWYRIAVSFDNSIGTPALYVNGTKQILAVDTISAGTVMPDINSRLTYGAVLSTAGTYSQYMRGKIVHPLIYNRILTDAEVAAFPADPLDVPTNTTGLVFQGFVVPTKHLADYIGTLGSSDKLFDNIHSIVGKPVGNPAPVGFYMAQNTGTVSMGNASNDKKANGSSLTFSHTVAAGDDKYLHVFISKRALNDTTSVLWGSTPLTLKATDYYASGNYPEFEIWGVALGDMPADVTANIVVTLPSNDWFEVSAVDTTGTNQIQPYNHHDGVKVATGTGTTPGLTISSRANDLVIDILALQKGSPFTTLSADAGQTPLMILTSDGNWTGASSSKPGASSVTVGWTISAPPTNWILAVVSIQGVDVP